MREAKAIVEELRKYDQALYEKPRWVVLNKLDLVPDDERPARIKDFLKRYGWKGPSFVISALNGEGCKALTYAIMAHLDQAKAAANPSPD